MDPAMHSTLSAPQPRAFRWRALLLLALCLAAAPAGAQAGGELENVGLYPGDVVRVVIWREPDLGGEFTVDARGMLTLPMIGEQPVAGLTVEELRAELVERYRVNLRNPSIAITPMRRVQILGEVNRPGQYTLDPTTSLAGAIAMAMGANPQGDLNRIRIVRDGEVLAARVSAQETLTGVEIRSGDQIFVGQKSWLARNSVAAITAALMIPTAVTALLGMIR